MKYTGVTARGIVSPIFSEGDDLVTMTCDAVIQAAEKEGFSIGDRDIIGVTESVVARSQGNYADCEAIASDIAAKFPGDSLGLVFPILSRNRFSILLKAVAMTGKKLYVQLSYPGDEVGNALILQSGLDESGVNPYTDSFSEEEFRRIFGKETVHPFTGVDYIEFYKSLGQDVEMLFSNNPCNVLTCTDQVLCCDIHSRHRTKQRLKSQGAKVVLGLDDILTRRVNGSGYHPVYGLLGSNMSGENRVKLFPRDCQPVVAAIQQTMKERTGKQVEVLIYGDGCFKDPVGGIWEFADPVVSPAYTSGLEGTPNELKMKYFADNQLKGLSGEALAEAMRQEIRGKDRNLVGTMAAQGTTPRRYVDLIGSLCDLTSGSGDRGTPVVLIQGYFDNFAS